ncbi:MAG: carboxypeptidase-like regulatory domain-containing protein [Gemmatimonadaceae bacterium]|nr:carboxypeptidase-like regulatory domain-containing protein [Gemmatimonadaceae bacterium]
MRWSLPPAVRRAAVVCALLAPWPAGALIAQTLRGTVVRPDGAPVAGAIVLAVRNGRDSVRTITSARGLFALSVRVAGTYAITVHRIGYRPTIGPTVSLTATETPDLRIVTTSEVIQLGTITATRGRSCRGRTDEDAVAVVWEEARKALEASTLAAEAGPITGQWIEHRGTLAPDLQVVREQAIVVREQPTLQVFRSVAPQDLATNGFTTQGGDTLAYFAPDQRVLLSPEFAASHCFGLEASAGDSLIGITFTPREPPLGTRTDITGVVWLHRRSAELRRVDFEYVGAVEAAALPQRAGSVRFARLDDGRFVVTGWRARLPLFTVRPGRVVPGMTRIVRHDTLVRAVAETGGDVLTLANGPAVLFRQPAPMALVQLEPGRTGPSFSGAEVLVAGTNVVANVDATGIARIGPLPVGRYAATVKVPAYDTLGIEPLSITVKAALAPAIDTLVLPPVATLFAGLCGREAEDGALLRGTVRNADGERVRGARVLLSYLRTDARAIRSGGFALKPESRKTGSDILGDWRFCGVPRGTDVVLAIEGPDGGAVRERFRIDPARMTLRRDAVLIPGTERRATLGFDGPTNSVDSPTNIALAGRSVLGEFDSRHQRGEATQSLSRQQILDRRFVQTWQVISALRAVRVYQTREGTFAMSGRSNLPSLRTVGAACPFTIVLDGITMVARNSNGVDLNELPAPERLHGVELYAGGTRLPALYASLAGAGFCGVIGLWTER